MCRFTGKQVRAIQWNGHNKKEVCAFINKWKQLKLKNPLEVVLDECRITGLYPHHRITLGLPQKSINVEGRVEVELGDWIIFDPNLDQMEALYSMHNSCFREQYE